jgi:CHAD domain-containing protein
MPDAVQASSELALTSTYHAGAQAAGILRGHIAAALTCLGTAKPSGARIHSARKELKQARATLRLMRAAIAPDHYDEEDAELRRVARMLNDARDAEVLLRSFAWLRKSVKQSDPPANLEPIRKLLLNERRRAVSTFLGVGLKEIRAALDQARQRTRDWSVSNDLDLLRRGMQRTYGKGRVHYRAACDSRTDDSLHAWRKQVKYCGYQIAAIRSISPGKMSKRLKRCTRLADLLGKDHDLALLHNCVAAADLDAASALRLDDAIKRERRKLQRRALELGARLYRTKPRNFEPFRCH